MSLIVWLLTLYQICEVRWCSYTKVNISQNFLIPSLRVLLTIITTPLILLMTLCVRFWYPTISRPCNSNSNDHFPKAPGTFESFMYCFRRAVTSDPSSFSVQFSHGPRWSFHPLIKTVLPWRKKPRKINNQIHKLNENKLIFIKINLRVYIKVNKDLTLFCIHIAEGNIFVRDKIISVV